MNKIKEYSNFLLRPVFFVITLISASYSVLLIEKLKPSDFGHYSKLFEKEIKISKQESYPIKTPAGKLTDEEIQYAKIAWKYFENNYNESTGMVNGSDRLQAFSIADLGCYLMGLVSAYELRIIDSLEFDKRIQKTIETLHVLPLYENTLPNKKYNSSSLNFYTNQNNVSIKGVGWSAIDIGRFFVFVNKIKTDFPQYFHPLRNSISKWKINEMLIDGFLYGIYQDKNDKNLKAQEGNLGYEEYSARGLSMSGYDVSQALEYTDFLKFVKLGNTEIAIDTREAKVNPGFNYMVSDPYVLEGIEYGWNFTSSELAFRVFTAQKNRFMNTHIITACGEDYTEKTPFYAHNALYADKKSWHCFTPKGFNAEKSKTVYTKIAFGWYVLFDDEYSTLLFSQVKYLYDYKRGWYVGKYENSNRINKTITASTNGLILEALNYKVKGKLINF